MSRFAAVLALMRGWVWRMRSGVECASTPRIIGPRCRLLVERGGRLSMGRQCSFDRDVEIVVYRGGRLVLGDQVYVGHGSTIACADTIEIGADTMVADLVSIRDMNHRRIPGQLLRESGLETRSVHIGSNCWIASKATIVAGADIGDNVTVGANAVVVGRVNADSTVGGIPARPLGISANV